MPPCAELAALTVLCWVLCTPCAGQELGAANASDDGSNVSYGNTNTTFTVTSTTTLTTTSYIKPNYWQSISCGADYSLGVTTNGTGWKWGIPFSEREKAIIQPGTIFKYMVAGYTHSCTVTREGDTYCFGRNHEGQGTPPRGVYFESMSLGESHTCGLTDRQEILCWGASSYRRLEIPTYVNKWLEVSVGAFSACGLTTRGKILCWGHEAYGRLNVPFFDEDNILWSAVSCGSRHCCGILTDRAVQIKEFREEDNVACWGDNELDQLDIPADNEGRTGAFEKFQQIAAGHSHTCGLTVQRRIWCWGDVFFWGIVSGIPVGENITRVFSGGHHSCAETADLRAVCWGDNHWHQAEVPVDDRTLPPALLDYHIHPMDIWSYDRYNRIARFDDGWPTPHHTYQWVHMACFIPEPAKEGSVKLVFTQWAGTEDPYSPHVMRFPSPRYDIPGSWEVNVSAFDLRKWHDIRWGFNAVVETVESQVGPDGNTDHRLVDGGRYRVDLTYEDTTGHNASNHTIEAFDVEYDLITLPPIVYLPKSGRTKQGLWCEFELLERMTELTIFMTFEGPAVPGEFARDDSSPHEVQLRREVMTEANHTIELHLRDTETNIYFERHPNVSRTYQAGFQSPYRELTDRANYTFSIRAVDRFGNPPAIVDVPNLAYFKDLFTEPVRLIRPTQLVDPLFIEYIIPESVDAGTLRVEFVWLRNRPDEPRAQPDLQSPHRFWVRPESEIFGVPVVMKFGTADLFKDADDLNGLRPQPDVARFESTGTPVVSFLQPWSEYMIQVSYVDRFRNPRAYLNRTLWTNFTEPAPPGAPYLVASTTSTLALGWARGHTGGVRISQYDLEMEEQPLQVSDPDSLPDAEKGTTFLERSVQGQTTNITTFTALRSARHFLARVRSVNVLGASNWSEWTLVRTKSTCGDARVYDGEECDDGNFLDDDGCNAICQIEIGWECSNELRDDPSVCEPGGMDGLRVGDEECDDCNNVASDGCSPEGKIDYFWECEYMGNAGIPIRCSDGSITYTSDRCYIHCGDGLRHYEEGCDDGNFVNGDGCTNECLVEEGYECKSFYPNMLTSVCDGLCGDGLLRGTEECDDANDVSDDGCTNCKIDFGYFCERVNVTVNITVNASLNVTNVTQVEVEECKLTCYDGVIHEGEECDDANMIDHDGCTHCYVDRGWSCQAIQYRAEDSPGSYCVPICGDGYRIVHGSRQEECDDGNNVALDGCSPDCTVEPGYTCEGEVVNGTLLADVCKPICGDGLTLDSESCDDGNFLRRDGCSKDCVEERGYSCTTGTLELGAVCSATCGDGLVVYPLEACDDGNINPNDGCSSTCTVEEGYVCPLKEGTQRSECSPKCGDGILIYPEQCDDGGVSSDDGCSAQCLLEEGWVCSFTGECSPICGDGIRLEGEECDDGNVLNSDGCDSICTIEPYWECRSYVLSLVSTTSVCETVCGDGYLFGEEECDDGNVATGDGCDSTCRVEADYLCCQPTLGGPSVCEMGLSSCEASFCGNGVREEGEECDDGNTECCDGCNRYCAIEQGWECENYGPVPDICVPVCGDGFFVAGEQCDDANERNSDGCGSNCRIERGYSCTRIHRGSVCVPMCGDGLRTVHEECDDGNLDNFDGCNRNCRVENGFHCRGGSLLGTDLCVPICGDGIRIDASYSELVPPALREQCDTGSVPDPGCDAVTCKLAWGFDCARLPGSLQEECHPVCGDGNVSKPYEQCDDGNNVSGDGCGRTCQVEELWTCSYDIRRKVSVCNIRCGDGRRHKWEPCDDGNNYDGDGCTSGCTTQGYDGGYECLGGTATEASFCKPICGDGVQVFGEDCDDGNRQSLDGCDSTCQVEPMYFCTRAPLPFTFIGSMSECTRTCGDAVVSGDEECDEDVVPDPWSILNRLSMDEAPPSSLYRYCEHCRLVPGRVCGDGLRGNNGTAFIGDEECDDGNDADGDGCDASCHLEPGWSCTAAPAYVLPLRGDSCSTVCGDGAVAGGEECDDGNLVSGDGCSSACAVEPYMFCFQNVSSQFPGLNGSYCVETRPPKLLFARLDTTYASMFVGFDRDVAPLDLSEEGYGNETDVVFNCTRVLDYDETVKHMGITFPKCSWLTFSEMLVEFGTEPFILPGDPVQAKAGVLRSSDFAVVAAPAHSIRADPPPNTILEPRAVISGLQVTATCKDVTQLDSSYSEGHAGRAMFMRWELISVMSVETHRFNESEAARTNVGLRRQLTQVKIIFPRSGYVESEIDLFIDRSIKPGYIYVFGLEVTNVMRLVDTAFHVISTSVDPTPLVTSAIGRFYRRVPTLRWAELAVTVDFAPECFRDGEFTVVGQELTTWSHTLGSPHVDVDAQRGQTSSVLALRPGTLSPGRHALRATTCVNLTQRLCYDTATCNVSNTSTFRFWPKETCSYLTFRLGIEGSCGKIHTCEEEERRRLSKPGRALTEIPAAGLAPDLVDAAEGASLHLISFPRGGDYVPGAPELPEADSPLMQLLRTVHDPAGNANFVLDMERLWGRMDLNPNSTSVLGAVVVARSDAIAWLRPRVSWQAADRRTGITVAVSDPPQEMQVLGGSFLSIPSDAMTSGSRIIAEAELLLDASTDPSECKVAGKLEAMSTFAVNVPPVAGYMEQEVLPVSWLIYLRFTQWQWAGRSYPLQYRLELEEPELPTRLLLSDWSYALRQRAFLLPRFNKTVVIHGAVRDPAKSVSTIASEPIFLTSDPDLETLFLSEYREGGMDTERYNQDVVVQLLSSVMQAAAPYGALAQMQVLQDVVYRALGGRFDPTVSDCTVDCGLHGDCPTPTYRTELVNISVPLNATNNATNLTNASDVANASSTGNASNGSSTGNASNASDANVTVVFQQVLVEQSIPIYEQRCVCEAGWIGIRCERSQAEADAQVALTKVLVKEFRTVITGTQTIVAFDVTQGRDTLTWLLSILARIVEDCRRVSLDSLEGTAVLTADLMLLSKRSAINAAATVAAELLSQIFACMPQDEKPTEPLTYMPSPLTVLDTLGSSNICRTLNGTNTKLCYDLSSSVVTLTCPGVVVPPPFFATPIFNTSNSSFENTSSEPASAFPPADVHCRADLELGLSEPYPCSCPVPDELFLGFGRSDDQAPLWETLASRNDHAIVWRTIANILYNHSALVNATQDAAPGPELSSAAWFAMTEQNQNVTLGQELQADKRRLLKRNTVVAIHKAGELLGDALALEMVPGQAPVSVDAPALSARAEVSVVTAEENVSRGALQLSSLVKVEVDFVRGRFPNASMPPPTYAPMGAVLWAGAGGVFSWLDGSTPVRSGVVQARLFGSGGAAVNGTREFSRLRYRFLVPLNPRPAFCKVERPPTHFLENCCAYRDADFAIEAPATCPVPAPPPPTSTTTTPPPSPPPEGPPPDTLEYKLRNNPASLLSLSGQLLPFDRYLQGILRNATLWMPPHAPIALASRRVRIRGGDLRFGRICSLSGALSVTVVEGEVFELPELGDDICSEVLRKCQVDESGPIAEFDWYNKNHQLLEFGVSALQEESTQAAIRATRTTTTSRTTTTDTTTATSTTSTQSSTTTTTVSFTTATTAAGDTSSTSTTATVMTTTTSRTATITTLTTTTTTTGWCQDGSADAHAWCPSGYTQTQKPVYADVILDDPQGFVLLSLSGVQVQFSDDSEAVVSVPNEQNLTAVVTAYASFFLFLSHSMLQPPGGPPGTDNWFFDLGLVQSLPAYDSLNREFLPFRPTVTRTATPTTTTSTITSVTTMTSTTSTTTPQEVQAPPAMLAHFLEGIFDEYLDLIVEAANSETVAPARSLVSERFATRAAGAAARLDAWSEAAISTGDLYPTILGFEPDALSLDLQEARPLDELLLALDAAVPAEWNESYWRQFPPGPGWVEEEPLPVVEENVSLEADCVVISNAKQPLRVIVLNASGLRDADSMPGMGASDAYVEVEVVGKPSTRFRTRSVSGSDPVWNHRELVAGSTTSDSFTFRVYDEDAFTSDDSLGSATLGSISILPEGFDGELQLEDAGKGISAQLRVRVELTTGARAVECVPPPECAVDVVTEFECVAWSVPLERWVLALGCEVAEGRTDEWFSESGLVEVVCECEEGAVHSAVAVAARRPGLPPKPNRLIIVSRQFVVAWHTKLHRYNMRGVFMMASLFIAAAVHLLLACYAELRWRKRARRVHSRAERTLEVKRGLSQAVRDRDEARKNRVKEIKQWMPEAKQGNLATAAWGAVDTLASQAQAGVLAITNVGKSTSDVTRNATEVAKPTTDLALVSADHGQTGELQSFDRVTATLASWKPYRAGFRTRPLDKTVSHGPSHQVALVTSQPLKITIKGAKRLRDADWMPGQGSADPYCVCEVPGKPHATFRTEVKDDTTNPVWNCEARIESFNVEDSLVFTVYDRDFGKADDMLGTAAMQGVHFLPGGFDGELPLTQTMGAPSVVLLKILPGHPEDNPEVELSDKEKAYMIRMIRRRVPYDKIARLMGVTLKQVQDVATTLNEPNRDDGEWLLTKRPKVRCPMFWALVTTLARASPRNVWRACLSHHKVLFLPLDTQAWVFSAPERAAVLHMSLWWNAAFQAANYQMVFHFLPGDDPACPLSGRLTWNCLLYSNVLGFTVLSAVQAVLLSNITMVLARGRSFNARTVLLRDYDREEAFLRHFLGPYPMLTGATDEVKARLWSAAVKVSACICCRRAKPVLLAPLHWLPSLVPPLMLLVAFVSTWLVMRTMFFFTSSSYMHEVSYSEPEGFVEVVFPPAEQAEARAAAVDATLDASRILVPQMQRFLVLFAISVLLQLLVLEPLLLAMHLILGEPSIEEAWEATVARMANCLVGCCCGCCRRCAAACAYCCSKPKPPPLDEADLALKNGDHAALKRMAIEKGLLMRVAMNMDIEDLHEYVKNPVNLDDDEPEEEEEEEAVDGTVSNPSNF